jgi:hypothetical protein
LTHWQHLGFFGYYPANSSLVGILGDLVSTGLGVLGVSWQSAPSGAYSSVEKGALLAGFGRENTHLVPLDDKQAMRTSELKRMIEADCA